MCQGRNYFSPEAHPALLLCASAMTGYFDTNRAGGSVHSSEGGTRPQLADWYLRQHRKATAYPPSVLLVSVHDNIY